MIRKAMHEAVEAAMARGPTAGAARDDLRLAGERFGDALVAHAEAVEQPIDAHHPADAGSTAGVAIGRAQAFRAMAGVRR